MPVERLTSWSAGVNVGVPGGIPTNRTHLIDVTQAPFNADKTGTTDCRDAFSAALAASKDGDVIYFPAGRYLFNGAFGTGMNIHNRTIRGAGMDVTFIDSRANGGPGITVGTGSSFNYPTVGNTITAGLTKGSTSITLGDTSAFSVGQLIKIDFENETDNDKIKAGAVPVLSVNDFPYMRRQMVRITGKSGNTLTIFPGIYHTPTPGRTAQVTQSIFYTVGVGLEDFTLLNDNGSAVFSIEFQDSIGCWVRNVKSKNTSNYHVMFSACLQSEIRGCHFADRKTGGTNGAGILLLTSSGCLIEDNIVENVAPNIEVNHGSSGNVFAYNVFERSGMNINHGPHNAFNLYEGNISQWIQSDGYFGSNSEDLIFRNWLHGTTYSDSSVQTFLLSFNRFARNMSVVGNIMGTAKWPYGSNPYSFGNPNMGNSSYTGTAQMSTGSFPVDWKMTATVTKRSSDTQGELTLNSGSLRVGQFRAFIVGYGELTVSQVSGNVATVSMANGTLPPLSATVPIAAGIQGYQDLDLDVGATTLLKGNLHMFGSTGPAVPASQALGSDTLPASYFRTSKPAYFGDLAWPAFDPSKPTPSYLNIPAGVRFVNKQVSAPVTTASTSAPTNVKVLRQ